jgi:low density lipoprotein receptor-related protein 5/6
MYNMSLNGCLVLNRNMFWADWGESPKLERAGMDGDETTRSVLVSGIDMYWPNSLTIDYDAGRLYWTDVKLGSIQSVRLDGTDHRRLHVFSGVGSQPSPSMSHPASMTLVDDLVYWSDWQAMAIYAAAKSRDEDAGKEATTGGGSRPQASYRVVATNVRASIDIRAYEAQRQPQSEFQT